KIWLLSGWNSPARSLLPCRDPKQVVGVQGLYSPRFTMPPGPCGDMAWWVRPVEATTRPLSHVGHTVPPSLSLRKKATSGTPEHDIPFSFWGLSGSLKSLGQATVPPTKV